MHDLCHGVGPPAGGVQRQLGAERTFRSQQRGGQARRFDRTPNAGTTTRSQVETFQEGDQHHATHLNTVSQHWFMQTT